MTAAVVLWTFVFFAPPAAGRSVTDLTEKDCRQLKIDAERVMGGRVGQSVGECYRQGK